MEAESKNDKEALKGSIRKIIFTQYISKLWHLISPFLAPILNFCIVPGTRLAFIRIVVTLCAALVQSLIVSFQVAFDIPAGNPSYIFNQLASIILVSDIILNFFTAFFNKDGKIIFSKKIISQRYLRGYFIFDFLSNFPIEWFTSEHAWLLIRVFVIYKPIVWVKEKGKLLNVSITAEAAKYLLLLVYIIHFYSCIWWFIAIPNDAVHHTWSFPEDSHKPTSIDLHTDEMKSEYAKKYFYSVYWVLNLITVPGFADLEAPSLTEKIVGLFMFLSGLVLLGYLSASVTSILANRGAQKARHQQKLLSVSQYMNDNAISAETQDRVQRYYNYLWSRNKGVDSKSIFEDFPTTFQAELALDINGTLLAKVPLFQNTEIGFMRMLSLALQPVLFLPMEYVVRKGDIGTEMFFIHKGSVDVVSEDGSKVFASMLEGSFFGEIALFFSRPRTANIRCATYCDIYVLSKSDLDAVLEFYPDIRESILKEASERLKENLKRNNVALPAPPPASPAPAPAPVPAPTPTPAPALVSDSAPAKSPLPPATFPRSQAELPNVSRKISMFKSTLAPTSFPVPQIAPPSSETPIISSEPHTQCINSPQNQEPIVTFSQGSSPSQTSEPLGAPLVSSHQVSASQTSQSQLASTSSQTSELQLDSNFPNNSEAPKISPRRLTHDVLPAPQFPENYAFPPVATHSISNTAQTENSILKKGQRLSSSAKSSHANISPIILNPPGSNSSHLLHIDGLDNNLANSNNSKSLQSSKNKSFHLSLQKRLNSSSSKNQQLQDNIAVSNQIDSESKRKETDRSQSRFTSNTSIILSSPEELEEVVYDHLSKTGSICLGDSIYQVFDSKSVDPSAKTGIEISNPTTSSTSSYLTCSFPAPSRRASIQPPSRDMQGINLTMGDALDIALESSISNSSRGLSRPLHTRRASIRPQMIHVQPEEVELDSTDQADQDESNRIMELPINIRRS
ncbi:Kinesin-like protein kif27 [Coelomomyces lativittatus]|nr:Kinesin-like protein kif27 [Coelomomyces lativittatus]